MVYGRGMLSVKQVSRVAGVTPRTLRYYDGIGLLKPSRIGDNGYRCYDDQAMLRLQQILLYRELGVPLQDIKRIMDSPEFNVIAALENHREELRKRIARTEHLMATVDDTILYLKGKKKMTHRQLFEPFSDEQQAKYEKEAMEMYDPATVKASIKKWKGYTAAEKQRIGEEANAVYGDMLRAMPKGPSSPEAQAAVQRWRRHMEYFWTPNEQQLLGLVDGYNNDPRFKANFDRIHPNLAEFMREAVKVYVKGRGRRR
jgi:DNA-binding transcriptional MerR regulator